VKARGKQQDALNLQEFVRGRMCDVVSVVFQAFPHTKLQFAVSCCTFLLHVTAQTAHPDTKTQDALSPVN